MQFGEKIKKLREQHNLTQAELAEKLGITIKSVSNYESKNTRPRHRSKYEQLADIFEVNINYLLTDEDDFILSASEKYGYNGAKEAQMIIQQTSALFAGGKLPEEDKDALFEALQEAYWSAKLANKKYSSNKSKNKKQEKHV